VLDRRSPRRRNDTRANDATYMCLLDVLCVAFAQFEHCTSCRYRESDKVGRMDVLYVEKVTETARSEGRSRRCVGAVVIGVVSLAYAAYIGIYSMTSVVKSNVDMFLASNSVKNDATEVTAAIATANSSKAASSTTLPINTTLATAVVSQEFIPPLDGPKLDFYIAGFPKCGTSTMNSTLSQSNEMTIWPKEQCDLISSDPDPVVYQKLTFVLNNNNTKVQQGLKCPTGICCSPNAVRRLQQWFPDVKLIFGIRHPVMYFQSFYNYRAYGILRAKDNPLPIPPAETLIGDTHYYGVGTISAKFERYLIRLQRDNSTQWMPFKVLLYHMEQIRDDSVILRETLRTFLNLKEPVPPFSHTNEKKTFNGTIDICDSKYDNVRRELVANGKETQRWIREEFMKNPHVVVANEDHFYELLEQWSIDPCTKESE